MTGGHSVRFGPGSGSVRRAPSHRLKRTRSQYMSTPQLNNYGSNWRLNHLNANPSIRKSHNSVAINMNMTSKTYTNRHIASAHKLLDGLNEEDASFKSRLRSVLTSYNFQLAMVILVICDCMMVLGEMIIEMQLNNSDCGGGGHNEEGLEKVTGIISETVTVTTESVSELWTTMVNNFTEQPNEGEEQMVAESEGHSIFSTCSHVHLLHQTEKFFHLTSIFILFSFNIELVLRLYIFGYKYFFHWEIALDAIVVIVSFWLDVAFLDSGMKQYLYLLIILRLWRVLRIVHAIITAIKTPYERQVEKLKKKRKILQRDLAKAYFYSNMLEEEITHLRGRIAEFEAAARERDEEEEEEDEVEDETEGEKISKTDENQSDKDKAVL